MTIPNVVKDLFIFPAYLSLSPEAIVCFCLYEPAKSTKCSFGVLRTFFPSSSILHDKDIVKIE
jgi:hypothetical protein